MSDRAKAIIKDVLDNHLPRIVEGLQKGYPDENQILVAYDHAVRARILAEQPEPLDEADYISNKQDEAWLDAIAKQWNTLTGKAWETKDDIEANVTALFEQLTASQARVTTLEAMLQLPDDLCLACGGTGGHHEGCTGTTGLIALQARVKELEQELQHISKPSPQSQPR